MPFELFTEYGASSRNTVTLRASGYLFIPEMLRKRSPQPNAECVRIYVDEELSRIAIEFASEPEEAASGIKPLSLEKSGVSVNILPILRYLDIDRPQKKCILKTTRENDMLVVDLNAVTDEEENEEKKDDSQEIIES